MFPSPEAAHCPRNFWVKHQPAPTNDTSREFTQSCGLYYFQFFCVRFWDRTLTKDLSFGWRGKLDHLCYPACDKQRVGNTQRETCGVCEAGAFSRVFFIACLLHMQPSLISKGKSQDHTFIEWSLYMHDCQPLLKKERKNSVIRINVKVCGIRLL